MTAPTAPTAAYVSIHDQRRRLVADALLRHSELTEDAALTLAGHALDALDHIPEKLR
ncbi:DUF6307 family protein [Pseudonocardia humida]|uniref:ANTAR domain-containing protein n=1 Tax=Pseudonocardia humida TaxID=2800819 RepID=A0ABT0ZTI1_9PSEU|nr:DUF6307 family protein [Pseudonocardia humida]MCO1654028.1 hypothetical protein [Pseudonocardia humida]